MDNQPFVKSYELPWWINHATVWSYVHWFVVVGFVCVWFWLSLWLMFLLYYLSLCKLVLLFDLTVISSLLSFSWFGFSFYYKKNDSLVHKAPVYASLRTSSTILYIVRSLTLFYIQEVVSRTWTREHNNFSIAPKLLLFFLWFINIHLIVISSV